MSLTQFEEKMNKSLDAFKADLATIRAGRANPHMLDKISVDYYGTQTPVNQLGNITVPEARILQISPYDASVIKEIEKSILKSDLGITPNSDGKVIRLVLPELTEDRRKALTKDVKKKGEDAKVVIRNTRRDGMDAIKKQLKAKEITEDEVKTLEDNLQKITDKFIANIDTVVNDKSKELMSV